MSEDFEERCGKVCPENRTVACTLDRGHEQVEAEPLCVGISYLTGALHTWPTVPDADEPVDWQQRGWFETRPNPLPPAPLGWFGDPEPLPELPPSWRDRCRGLMERFGWIGDPVLGLLFVVAVLIVVALALAGAW